MTAATASPVSTLDRLVNAVRSEVGNLVSHAITLGGAYALIAHTDWTKIENVVTGAVAVGVGAFVNKIRSSVTA